MKKYILMFAAAAALLSACGTDDFTTHINRDPGPDIEATVSNLFPAVGEAVYVDVTYLPDAGVTAVEWDFGDGTTSTDESYIHHYEEAGDFALKLNVTTTAGGISEAYKRTVKVAGRSMNRAVATFDRNKIWVVAHRANSGDGTIPENSIPALQKCIDLGSALDMVEIDVRTTKDNVMVVIHDATVDRTTTGTGNVKDMTLEQIRALSLVLPDGTITAHKVPTLQDMLLMARGKVWIDLDFVSGASVKELFDIVDNMGMTDQCIYYTAGQKDMSASLLGYSPITNIFPRVDSESDINHYKAFPRVKLVTVLTSPAVSTDLSSKVVAAGMYPFTNILNQGGFTYDTDMLAGNYTGINTLLDKGTAVLQTDYPATLDTFLKSIDRR